MHNIRNRSDLDAVIARLEALRPDTARVWGSMSPAQMLWHCRQQLELGTGGLKVADMVPGPLRWILKQTVGLRLPFAKNAGTIPGIEAANKAGLDFDQEKRELLASLRSFASLDPARIEPHHPIFGDLNADEWGHLVYKHLDHHLRQFGL
jgi:hypothetical protein